MGSSMALGSAGASSAACCPSGPLIGLLAAPPCDAVTLLGWPFTAALLLGCPVTCRVEGGDEGDSGRSHGFVLCCVATAAPWDGACSAGSSDWPPLKLRHRTADARAKPEARETPAKAAHSLEAAILRCVVTAGRSHVPIGVAMLGGWPGPDTGRTQSAPKTELRGAGDAAAASPPEVAPCCCDATSFSADESWSPSPVDATACAVGRLRDVTLCLH